MLTNPVHILCTFEQNGTENFPTDESERVNGIERKNKIYSL